MIAPIFRPADRGRRMTEGGGGALRAVALVGAAAGHALWHRRAIHAMPGVRLVAVSDIVPPAAVEDAPLDGVAVFSRHEDLLARVAPDAVVVCTPPHTHLPITLDVLRAGVDVLVEKPPVAGLAEHATLAAAAAASGRAVQVNFQALGSDGLAAVLAAVAAGELGAVGAIGIAGTWWRPPAYWNRTPWAGKRILQGRPVIDGALLNPFAHAVMQGLAIAAGVGWGPPEAIEVERYRAAPIEVEDTGCLRVGYAGDRWLTVAVTLTARSFRAGDITVSGVDGAAVLEYPTDRVRLPGRGWQDTGRTGMLANLLAHRADPAVPLLAPLARTRQFTAVLEAVLDAPPPVPIDRRWLVPHDGGSAVDGVEAAVSAAAASGRTFATAGAPWASVAAVHRRALTKEETCAS
jgi:predicted dehydrogenase